MSEDPEPPASPQLLTNPMSPPTAAGLLPAWYVRRTTVPLPRERATSGFLMQAAGYLIVVEPVGVTKATIGSITGTLTVGDTLPVVRKSGIRIAPPLTPVMPEEAAQITPPKRTDP